MTDTPIAVARANYEIVNTRDLDAIDRLYHSKVMLNGQPSRPEEIREYCGAYLAAFEDLTIDVEQFVADGEWVASRVVARGTHTAQFGDLPATGRQIEVRQNDFVRVVDGQIVECWTLFDQVGLLQQVGALPAAAS